MVKRISEPPFETTKIPSTWQVQQLPSWSSPYSDGTYHQLNSKSDWVMRRREAPVVIQHS